MPLCLRVECGLECPICELGMSNRDDDGITLALFGAVNAYAACPHCFQEVGPTIEHDPEYRRRVRVHIYQRHGIVLKEPACKSFINM